MNKQHKLALIGSVALEHASRCLPPGDACRLILEEDIQTIRSGRDPKARLRDTQKTRDRRIRETAQGELLLAGQNLLKLATGRTFGGGKIVDVCTRCWIAVEFANGHQAGRCERYWQDFAIDPLFEREVSDDDILAAINIVPELRIEQIGREIHVFLGSSVNSVEVFRNREQAEQYIRDNQEGTYLKPKSDA